MSASIRLTPAQSAREHALLLGIALDMAMNLLLAAAAFWGGALTMLAETIRGSLLTLLEICVLLLLRRIHRGRMGLYEYGSGKLEQFVSLMVGASLAASALWLGLQGLRHFSEAPAPIPPGGALLSLVAGAANLACNLRILWAVWQAGRDGQSTIMVAQLRSRLVRSFASLVVMVPLVLGVALPGSVAGHVADIGCALFVALVMVMVAVSLWRASLPDLLDRSLGEERQAAINRVLAAHFDDYERLLAVRSRQSGKAIHVEVELGLDPAISLAQAETLVGRIGAALVAEMPEAVVTVIPRAARAGTAACPAAPGA
jgi:cation diffusion facilitator family transporter